MLSRGNDVGHAHVGVSYVFGRVWEVGQVGGSPRHKKRAHLGAFFVFLCCGRWVWSQTRERARSGAFFVFFVF